MKYMLYVFMPLYKAQFIVQCLNGLGFVIRLHSGLPVELNTRVHSSSITKLMSNIAYSSPVAK